MKLKGCKVGVGSSVENFIGGLKEDGGENGFVYYKRGDGFLYN